MYTSDWQLLFDLKITFAAEPKHNWTHLRGEIVRDLGTRSLKI